MADILIRGMEMPTGCASCDFAIYHTDSAYHYCFWLKKVFIKPDAKLKDCPLIELPPHGDLIDRDAILHEDVLHYVDTLNSSFGSRVKFSDLVRGAPVIVPPNKGEEA